LIRAVVPLMADEDGLRFETLLANAQRLVGFDTHHVVGVPLGSSVPCGSHVFASNWPREFLERFMAEKWFEHDPSVMAMKQSRVPVSIAEVRRIAAADPLLQSRLEERIALLGAHYFGVPILFKQARHGAVVFTRRHRPFSPDDQALLQLIAPALHLAASRRPSAHLPSPLTVRERECLGWASLGKTAGEIGLQLGISETTAVAHLNAATRKLDAVSRCHAVAEALRRGILD
jgi:LuxR family quorum sensing-dependent transcriptional regulator